MQRWREFFPLPVVRPTQALALDFLVENIESGVSDIFVEAPTGSGKSAIAMALAKMFQAQSRTTYISTVTVALENQYVSEYRRLGLRQLHAKRHYRCEQWGTCDLGSTMTRKGERAYKRCQADPCTYQVAKGAFMASDLSIANASFLLTCARHLPDWSPRGIAIFDEAHTLAETVAGNYAITIMAHEVAQLPAEGAEFDWLGDHYAHQLAIQIRELEKQFHQIAKDDPRDPALERLHKQSETAKRKLQNLEKLLADDPDEWVFDSQPDRLNILPLWGAKLAQELLPWIGGKRIYLSPSWTVSDNSSN
jgi:Rad3-related DNA helicase